MKHLIAALVDIACCAVEHSQHWYQTIGNSICLST